MPARDVAREQLGAARQPLFSWMRRPTGAGILPHMPLFGSRRVRIASDLLFSTEMPAPDVTYFNRHVDECTSLMDGATLFARSEGVREVVHALGDAVAEALDIPDSDEFGDLVRSSVVFGYAFAQVRDEHRSDVDRIHWTAFLFWNSDLSRKQVEIFEPDRTRMGRGLVYLYWAGLAGFYLGRTDANKVDDVVRAAEKMHESFPLP